MNYKKTCSISIVSHGQSHLIQNLLSDLELFSDYILEIFITLNIPEELKIDQYKNNIIIINNEAVKGFGSNHNQAFQNANGEFFYILNPDIRIMSFNFESFINKLSRLNVGVLSPSVTDVAGNPEDHIREFPTLGNLLKRIFFKERANYHKYSVNRNGIIYSEWIAGMFMSFHKDAFKKINGFDEKFFLYLEDVDICKRFERIGYGVCIDPENKVVHDAQRGSHRNLRLFFIHCNSFIKYFNKWGF